MGMTFFEKVSNRYCQTASEFPSTTYLPSRRHCTHARSPRSSLSQYRARALTCLPTTTSRKQQGYVANMEPCLWLTKFKPEWDVLDVSSQSSTGTLNRT